MNIRDIIMPALFAFAITFGVRYFLDPKTEPEQEVVTGRKRLIPSSADLVKAIDKTINFIDKKSTSGYIETKVPTANGYYIFTSEGAALKGAYFKHYDQNNDDYLCAFNPQVINEFGFIIGLNFPAPHDFELVENNNLENATELVYKAIINEGVLTKKFYVLKNNNGINLTILFDLNNTDSQLRLFMPTPYICGSENEDLLGLVNTQSSKTNIKEIKKDECLSAAWDIPKVFGTNSKFFASIVYAQDGDKAQRGAFKLADNQLISILETPRVRGSGEWNLKTYFGPKKVNALESVDSRLTQILNYGWLTSLSKIMLKVLNVLYQVFKNYGLAIIILTLIIKIILLPLTWNAESGLKKQAELEKKMNYIRQKYRNDPEALQREQLEIIRQNGMGLGAILANFAQFPFIIALQKILANSVELYKAPFMWIPNLSAPDPYSILSIVMGIMLLFGLMQNKFSIKKSLFPLGLSLFFISFSTKLSAGLVLAICVNVILSQLQSYIYRLVKRA
jgi:YidC/Oxa1 family membrane protein insertase